MDNLTVLIVSCGKRKSTIPCKAKDMYNSYRFQMVKSIAEQNDLQWFILSAKYGLLAPDIVIDPYDLCLMDCSKEYQLGWANNILDKLYKYNSKTSFVFLANNDYLHDIIPALVNAGYRVSAPFLSKNSNADSIYLENALYVKDVKEFYENVFRLAENTGGVRLFRECNGKMYWPQRGVYFFVDFQERTLFHGFPRIVRVGTHAVSQGSKSTLWNRLKTHKGTAEGGGNHRGSIFRLHVGNALIKKNGIQCGTWGVGQNASKEIKKEENFVEKLVSEYIGQLGVVVIDVDDLPSASSARAYIEKNAIALLSNLNFSLNFSTTEWLGNYSDRNEITDSGLWNINYVKSNYDPHFMAIFKKYIDESITTYKKR